MNLIKGLFGYDVSSFETREEALVAASPIPPRKKREEEKKEEDKGERASLNGNIPRDLSEKGDFRISHISSAVYDPFGVENCLVVNIPRRKKKNGQTHKDYEFKRYETLEHLA